MQSTTKHFYKILALPIVAVLAVVALLGVMTNINNQAMAAQTQVSVTVLSDFAPTITGVSPDQGPTTGGTLITITGNNLLDTTDVTIGGSPCGSLNVIDANHIECETPSHPAGPVDIVVTSPNGSDTLYGGFTYTAPLGAPIISGISPDQGPISGGTVVTITGNNLDTVTDIDFGGVACTDITVIDPQTIQCTTSAHVAGDVDVTVTNLIGSFTSYNAFSFVLGVLPLPPSTGLFGASISSLDIQCLLVFALVLIIGVVIFLMACQQKRRANKAKSKKSKTSAKKTTTKKAKKTAPRRKK